MNNKKMCVLLLCLALPVQCWIFTARAMTTQIAHCKKQKMGIEVEFPSRKNLITLRTKPVRVFVNPQQRTQQLYPFAMTKAMQQTPSKVARFTFNPIQKPSRAITFFEKAGQGRVLNWANDVMRMAVGLAGVSYWGSMDYLQHKQATKQRPASYNGGEGFDKLFELHAPISTGCGVERISIPYNTTPQNTLKQPTYIEPLMID